MRFHKYAFTLIELVVVVAIVIVLAGVAVMMNSKGPARAALLEARAGMESVRIQMMNYYFSHNQTYPWAGGEHYLSDTSVSGTLGLSATDLDGSYFGSGSYSVSIDSGAPGGFWVYCYFDRGLIARNEDFTKSITDDHNGGGYLSMNRYGQTYETGVSASGYPHRS